MIEDCGSDGIINTFPVVLVRENETQVDVVMEFTCQVNEVSTTPMHVPCVDTLQRGATPLGSDGE